MRILLAGATGFIGRHVARALAAAGHEVVGCARRRDEAFRRYPEIGWIRADFATDCAASVWKPRLFGFDALVNAVGILRERRGQSFEAVHFGAPRALFQACAVLGVHRVIQVSALGCDANPDSAYQSTKLLAERFLATLDLDWVVVRPSLVYGEDSPSSALFRLLARLPVIPLIADGGQRLQPIHVDDLSEIIVRLLARGTPARATLELAGPRPITYKAMLADLRASLGGGSARYVRIPLTLVRIGAYASDLIGKGPIGRDTLGMLLHGNVALNNAAPLLLGRRPTGIGEVARRGRNHERTGGNDERRPTHLS